MSSRKKLLSILTAFIMLAALFTAKPLTVKAEDFKIIGSNIQNNQTEVTRALKLRLAANLPLADLTASDKIKFTLTDSQGNPVYVLWNGSNDGKFIEISTYAMLKPNMDYTLLIPKDSFIINTYTTPVSLSEDFTINFRTRGDSTVKIGPHGDYADFTTCFDLLNMNSLGAETLDVLIEGGNYNVPGISLNCAGISFTGGYNSDFTKSGSSNPTVLSHIESYMFNFWFGDNFSEGKVINYKFKNLTFTQDNNYFDRSFIPIKINNQMPYVVNVDVEKCTFKNLLGNRGSYEIDEYASPISAETAGRGSLNLNVSQCQFLDNKYPRGHAGGITVYSKHDYNNHYNAFSSLKVTNSIFSGNTGFEAGAILGKSDIANGLSVELSNNTIVNNAGLIEAPRLQREVFVRNSGGITLADFAMQPAIKASMTNNIIWGNKVGDSSNDLLLYSETESEDIGDLITTDCTMDSNNIGEVLQSSNWFSEKALPFKLTNINALNADPLFKAPKSNDFHLTAASPMIDKGKAIDLKYDFEGNSRPKGSSHDIGAYEYQETAAPELAAISFAAAASEVDETSGKAVITVKRTGNTESKVTVKYSTFDGSAKASEDFTAGTGTVTFEAGEITKTFEVAILNDNLVEDPENFTVTLTEPSEEANLGEITTHAVTIKSEDKTAEKPQQFAGFTVSSIDVNETDGTVTAVVKRTGDTSEKATVNYATNDGTAKATEDFTAASGTLTFENGEAEKTIVIPILNDNTYEEEEAFTIILSSPSEGLKLSEITTLTVKIKSEDAAPVNTPQNDNAGNSTLPQTGGFVDFYVLVILGAIVIAAGIFFIKKKKLN